MFIKIDGVGGGGGGGGRRDREGVGCEQGWGEMMKNISRLIKSYTKFATKMAKKRKKFHNFTFLGDIIIICSDIHYLWPAMFVCNILKYE